ncbi:alpha--mannosyl-glycoprotein beta-2-n [Cystoisospora suis]|uniref:Alpha--mannosyl-glycoprotein beta-2-n n=1 Tax=Cystoisospora suis TaxID=483139 RepID=A0A2C6LGR1_9APIC|nr:alpha--mannosyl-glycoprotein beta-2-n [Cystoisospora suis]
MSCFDGRGGFDSSADSSVSFLSHVDCSAIDELDPSLADGHVLIYSREVPCELRLEDGSGGPPKDVGRLEPIRVKILLLGDEQQPQHVRVEVTSENDLFLNYTHALNEELFRQMQESQKLMIEFGDYPNVLVKMLNSCIKEPHSFLAVFIMRMNGRARLDFIQSMEYKFIELLSLDFLQSTEEFTRRDMTFRYNALKSKLALLQARLHDVGCLLKLKSPSLLLHLQKAAQQQAQRRQQQALASASASGGGRSGAGGPATSSRFR